MNFSALSIKNPIPAIMLFALLTLAGMLAYKANPVQDFPDIELPIVTVTAVLDGARRRSWRPRSRARSRIRSPRCKA
jgi:multidrug efflux pump subunit AcrB